MSKEPHLNLRPSPNWALPFASAAVFSLMAVLTIGEPSELRFSSSTVGKNCEAAIFTTFFLMVLTGLWVAIRGSNRRFCPSMRVRVSIVGLFCPLVLICISLLVEYIGYGTPTKASPGLEIELLTAAVFGEALVRFASHPVRSFLEDTD